MYEVIKPGVGLIKAWTNGVQLDAKSREQLSNLAMMPFIYKWVAAMPDAHWGMGATVGSVIATKGAIIPAAVGVDLGCGMIAAKTRWKAEDLPESLKAMRSAIEAAIPVGGPGVKGSWKESGFEIPKTVESEWTHLAVKFKALELNHPHPEGMIPYGLSQLGTLGTGNHFIEVCLDEQGSVWVMLHSGSRGAGNRIASWYIERAKNDMRRWFIHLRDQDLAYIPEGSEMFGDYWKAIKWAQEYAAINREVMLTRTLKAVSDSLGIEVGSFEIAANCHHNYVSKEHHYGENVFVTRKGAVCARKGVMGIIPGSMGAKSFIVRGKGNPESFESCSHGAGRVMSRGEAKRKITLDDHRAAVAGVECRIDSDVLDESPAAYKDIDAVMAAQSDLVEIVTTLKQVLCVKG